MKRDVLLITLLSLIFFVFGNWVLSITSPDEGKNLDASLRMLETKDFIVPQYNCQHRFEKPPMFYWMTDVSFLVFGVNEFSGRLVSGLSALGISILIYLIAYDLFGRETALKSSLIFLTFPHNWVEARGATPEMLLTFFMVLGLFLFLKGRYTIGWIALALAFLTKGPVGVILPIGVYVLWRRDLLFLNLRGLTLFFLIGSSWYALMIWKFGYAYFYKFFFYENIMRFTGQKSIHPYPFWYYVPIVLANLAFYLPKIPSLRRNWNVKLNPLLWWFVFVFLFYSIAKNKLHHYMLFAYPPLAIILGNTVSKRYIKGTVVLSACFIVTLFFVAHKIESERFTPKAVEILKKNPQKQVVFYKTDLSAIVFYTRRCIPRVEDPKDIPEGSLVVTRRKGAKELEGELLLSADEFGKGFALVEVKSSSYGSRKDRF